MARGRRGEVGQATLELAFCLPVVLLLVGAMLEIGLIAADQVRLEHAAREAARTAAVDRDEEAIEDAAAAGGLAGLRVRVAPGPDGRVQGEPVVVTIDYSPPAHVPIIGTLFTPEMTAASQMRIEKP